MLTWANRLSARGVEAIESLVKRYIAEKLTRGGGDSSVSGENTIRRDEVAAFVTELVRIFETDGNVEAVERWQQSK
jgi:hypothetical protein